MKKANRSKKGFSLRYIMLAAAFMVMFTQLGWSYYHTNSQYVTIQVHKGDTVWDIASAATNDKSDVRSVVYDIVSTNGLADNEDIHPGQMLKIPVDSQSLTKVQEKFEVK